MAMVKHAASLLEMAHRDHDTLAATVDLPQVARLLDATDGGSRYAPA